MIKSRFRPFAVGAASIAALGFAATVDISPRLIWNASASAPIGLYGLTKHAPELGDFVLIEADARLQELIAARNYLPPDVPLLKRVAALPGARICREGSILSIDGVHVADALAVDSQERAMPSWSGCFLLGDDEIFLLNFPLNSLDGRYFGATKLKDVIGVAVPLITWGQET